MSVDVGQAGGIPNGATIAMANGSGANSSINAILAAVAGRTTYILGCVIASTGATAASVIVATVSGMTSTLSIPYAVIAGVTLQSPTISLLFPGGLPASAVNTAITVNLPATGAGNTNANVFAWGYQL